MPSLDTNHGANHIKNSSDCIIIHDRGGIEDSTPVQQSSSNMPDSITEVSRVVVNQCKQSCIENPVEILRLVQKHLVTGKALEISDVTVCPGGETNFILVDKSNILETVEEEILLLTDHRKTLEVSFYGKKPKTMEGLENNFSGFVLEKLERSILLRD
eukprot:gene20873-22924_t